MGAVQSSLYNADEAQKAYTAVLKVRPSAVDAQIALAHVNAGVGRGRAAEDFARQAVRGAPNNPAARFALARALFVQNQLDEADRTLTPVLSAVPNSPEILSLQGQIAVRRSDSATARRSFTRALELDPHSAAALRGLVEMDIVDRKPAEGARRAEAALAKAPKDPGVLLVAGRAYAAAGDLARSEAVLQQAIKEDASMLEAYHVLGQILVRQKRLDDARAAYENRVTERPDDVAAHTMIGMILLAQGRVPQARAAFEQTLAVDARAAVASNNLAYLDAEAGTNLDVALNRAQAAKAALPDDADVNDTLGWIYVKQGLPALAVSPLEQAIQKKPSEPVYHYHLGVAHQKAGDKDRARDELSRALSLSSSFSNAADARRALETLGR